jgi:hypothetical protein
MMAGQPAGAPRMSRNKLMQRFEWWYRGRAVVVVEYKPSGPPSVTCKVGRDRIHPTSREAAADWLKEHLPRLSHDERYAVLFGD